MGLNGFSLIDYVGLVSFVGAWVTYYVAVERTKVGAVSLNRLMNRHRYQWKRVLAGRDNRIIDANINASLQNGTAFFASTSLIAIGGSLTLLRFSDEVITLFGHLPLGVPTSRGAWEMKVIGLTVIFVYAFFKFAWSYRLFNYAAILIGAVPEKGADSDETIELAAWRAASMNTVAGRHFNRGQRAFFFALAYLGWFVSAYVLIASTAFVLYVMWHRQFASDALGALQRGPWPEKP
ncbi:DUF599 domain-containing protein [Enterovirga rhinocerotis]|uniref:Putative membrane protein n=1 Tax=Enterovirga rhinocerotis TaxID=1339210 RepID=A0A4R7C918_9HYPH|nr:DUF599 family protein [Enterovirga rhinocerotis]TDR94502.1 putative membrane protein [Enterovirga rhinocerotis]